MKMLENKTIFLVEDDPQNLAIIRTILLHQGASVPFDHWGRGAMMKIRDVSSVLDLILLDLMLPSGQTGHEIFKKIRTDSALDDIPIVAVSAADPSIEIPRTKELGFSGFISKPIRHNLFPKQIVSILEGGEIWESGYT